MKVTNLTSPRSDRPVANQYEITADDGTVTFQSYETTIAKKEGWVYTISADWCYSVTTSKYFGQWLRSFGWRGADIAELKKFLKKAKAGDTFYPSGMNSNATMVKYVEAL